MQKKTLQYIDTKLSADFSFNEQLMYINIKWQGLG